MRSIRFGTIGGRANYIVWTRDICMHTEEGNTVIIDRAIVDRLLRRQHSVYRDRSRHSRVLATCNPREVC